MLIDLDIFKINTTGVKPDKGKILIAEPFLRGYYFARAIVLLTEHNEEGGMGLVLNKPLDLTLDMLVKDVPQDLFPIFCGGPVGNEKLFYLHGFSHIPGSIKINDNIFFGGDFAIVRQMIQNEHIQPTEIRFFLGYSGWEEGQLQQELEEDSWLVNNLESKSILPANKDVLWEDEVRRLGVEYAHWHNFPNDPEMN